MVRKQPNLVLIFSYVCHFSTAKYTGGLGNSRVVKALKDHSDTSVSHLNLYYPCTSWLQAPCVPHLPHALFIIILLIFGS